MGNYNKQKREAPSIMDSGVPLEEVRRARAKRNSKYSDRGFILLFLAVALGCSTYLLYRSQVPDTVFWTAFVLTIILVVAAFIYFGMVGDWMTPYEYYSIRGSRYANGDHRCVYCGWRGIWRKGEYQGNTTYCRCSKCKKALFIE